MTELLRRRRRVAAAAAANTHKKGSEYNYGMRIFKAKGTEGDSQSAQVPNSRNLTALHLHDVSATYTRHLSKRPKRIDYEEEAKDEKEDGEEGGKEAVMAPMFQGFPVHAGSVRSLVQQRPERSGGDGGGGDLREARQSLYGLHRPQRSFVRCFLISVFNLAPLPLLRLRLHLPPPSSSSHNCSSSSSLS